MKTTKKYWESNSDSILLPTRKILNEYLLNLKLANQTEATITKYRSVLERFLRECSVPLDKLTTEDVRKWLEVFLVDKKAKTIDLYLIAFSSFFQSCLEEEHLDTVLIKKWRRPKIQQVSPKYLMEHEYAKVKMAAESLTLRDRALILFLFSSGCRSTEVSNLSMENINLELRTAEVKGKGKRKRKVRFSEECALVLKEYLQTRTDDGNKSLFTTRFGNRMLKGAIYQVTRKLGIKAGLKQSLHPHCCRHTFAFNMLSRGTRSSIYCSGNGTSRFEYTPHLCPYSDRRNDFGLSKYNGVDSYDNRNPRIFFQ